MSLNNMSVLFVEDNVDMQNEMKNILNDEVKCLHVASNGQEGYELYCEVQPDIIITDENMPLMSGLEMSEKIKKENPNQSIVLITAIEDILILKKALDIKIDKLCLKPLADLEVFIANLESIAKNIRDYQKTLKEAHSFHENNRIIDEFVLLSTSDLDGNIVEISSAFLNLSGYKREELIGKNHSIFKSPESSTKMFSQMWAGLINDKTWSGQLKNRAKDGTEYWIKTLITPIYDSTGIKIGYKSIKENITDKKRVEFLSEHDTLTGVYNRRKIEEELLRYKDKIDRYEIDCSVIFIDLDKFKDINDKFGHLVGDDILKEFTNVINNNLRKTDILARWGGEEFMIITPHLDVKSAFVLAEKLRKEIESFEFIQKIKITSSFGLSFFTKDKTINDVINEADKALYKSKSNGRNLVSTL